MELIATPLQDCYLIKNNIFKDERGFFYESHNARRLNEALGMEIQFVQDNQSFSSKNVLRGLHLQLGEYSQAKLVSVLYGKVWDVAVDLRKDSPSFGQYFGIELSNENKLQLFIPRGFAHGFLVLSEQAHFFYKCDNFYHKPAEAGIIYNDKTLNINWQISKKEIILSQKDGELPDFNLFVKNYL